jgi:hypothetical protein
MRLLILSAILFITISTAYPQSLKSISDNRFILTDSVYTSNFDSSLKKNSNIKKETRNGDYVTFSTGFYVPTTRNSSGNDLIPYTSFDLNINLGSVIYLDLGADAIFPEKEINLGLHGTLGVGFDIIPNKLFVHTGVGAIIIIPFVLTEIFTLRANYKFTKDISAGLDNKFISFGKSENLAYRYVVGLNFSYRFNN